MSRRVTEVVHVGVQDRRPTAFRWRGNRYVVREVLGHWRERRAWWVAPGPVGEVPAPRSWHGDLLPGYADECEVWRVEAARSCAGLHLTPGVYDLSQDAGAPPDIGSWRLLRVVD